MVLKRRHPPKEELVKQIKLSAKTPIPKKKAVRFDKLVSTGSTQLDLAISGGRVRGGGIPGGIIVEIFGPSGSGKTAVLAEICASAQSRSGEVMFLDPEARLDKEYARIYGVEIDKSNYHRPDTVTEMFDTHIYPWKPKRSDVINVVGTDSLAALSTDLELGEKGDKMGMRRAKEFSQGLRKSCRVIANKNWLIPCTNQVRSGDSGEVTPGGKGIPFYSSLRIRVGEVDRITTSRTVKLAVDSEDGIPEERKIDAEKDIGIVSKCFIKKSTIDDPYREAFIYIVFGYGIDDIRGNLQFYKSKTKSNKYDAIVQQYQAMNNAIKCIEDNDLEDELKNRVIDLWEEIEKKFDMNRKVKKR